jgi:hypothetical protein
MELKSAVDNKIPHMVCTVSSSQTVQLRDQYLAKHETLHPEHALQCKGKVWEEQKMKWPKAISCEKSMPKIETFQNIQQAVLDHQAKLKLTDATMAAANNASSSTSAAEIAHGVGGIVSHSRFGEQTVAGIPAPRDTPTKSGKAKKRHGAAAFSPPSAPPQKRPKFSTSVSAKSACSGGLGGGGGGSVVMSVSGKGKQATSTSKQGGDNSLNLDLQEVLNGNYSPGREISHAWPFVDNSRSDIPVQSAILVKYVVL